jgi:hypothetical protein
LFRYETFRIFETQVILEIVAFLVLVPVLAVGSSHVGVVANGFYTDFGILLVHDGFQSISWKPFVVVG